jgi:hypothetical protein
LNAIIERGGKQNDTTGDKSPWCKARCDFFGRNEGHVLRNILIGIGDLFQTTRLEKKDNGRHGGAFEGIWCWYHMPRIQC